MAYGVNFKAFISFFVVLHIYIFPKTLFEFPSFFSSRSQIVVFVFASPLSVGI
jgi:hypothetical protein